MHNPAETVSRQNHLDLSCACVAHMDAEQDRAAGLDLLAPIVCVGFRHAGLHQDGFQVACHLTGDVPRDAGYADPITATHSNPKGMLM